MHLVLSKYENFIVKFKLKGQMSVIPRQIKRLAGVTFKRLAGVTC